MKKALVFLEIHDNEVKKSSLEGLSVLYGKGFEVSTAAFGKGSDKVADSLGKWGVKKHYSNAEDQADQYNPETYKLALQSLIEKENPEIVLASSNNLGRDIFPRLAAKNDFAYMSDVTDMEVGDSLEVKRPLYAGKCTAQVTFTDDSAKIVLLRPNQIRLVDANESGSPENITLDWPTPSGQTETVSIEEGESEKLDLTEAEVIVSGGRGLKEADNFKLLHDLAEPMNATVGASRAVVDLGWVPHSLQVGQTGKTVAPNLYFAVGISGAIQHIAGMSGSKNIVAINKDEKAPIFQRATYGIVGDLFEVVPLLTEKIKSVK